MQKRVCLICNQAIVKNENVLIFSHPIKILNNSGDFDILGDFLSKVILVHFDCFVGKSSKHPLQEDSILTKYIEHSPELINSLHNTLNAMGEKISRQAVEKFYLDIKSNSLNYLITEYFKRKK